MNLISPFFSIIIPVYNVEKYIERCLNSCIHQTFENIEIIIVDDCGKDQSMYIVQKYAQQDKRIKIVNNLHNLGLFQARIAGEKHAVGQYILHVDSDDFIQTKTCEILYQKIWTDHQETKQWCSFCCFNMDFYPKNFFGTKPLYPTSILVHEQILKTFFINPHSPSWTIWNKAYKNTLIQKVNQIIEANFQDTQQITMAEDALKFFVIALFSQKSIGVSDVLYYYCISNTSITRNSNQKIQEKKIEDMSKVIKNLEIAPFINSSIKRQARDAIVNALISTIELEKRFKDQVFAYPVSCFRALKFHTKLQTIIRLSLYFVSFGKIKL